jgi:hypothetical protein
VSEDGDLDAGPSHKSPLRRGFDVCVVTPIGIAVSVVEEIPELLAEGRRRLEVQLGNALFVGRFVVNQKQRELSARLDGLLGHAAQSKAEEANGTAPPSPSPPGPERPAPDPAAEAIVGSALADYDTLSASQVVRRLESLGPEELDAVRRYEASTRNRRTILNRAGQLLDERPGGPPAG